MEIVAVEDKVIVEEIRIDPPEKKSDGGIIIPTSDSDSRVKQEPQVFGKVVSVGDDVKGIVKDDIIVGARHGGQAFIWQDKIYKTYMLGEIYGVIKESE